MKIVSNYKDYYDFLVSTYGIDPKCVYSRICSTEGKNGWIKSGIYRPPHLDFPDKTYSSILSVCDKLYTFVWHKGQAHYGESIYELTKLPGINSRIYYGEDRVSNNDKEPENLNTKNACPVILLSSTGYGRPVAGVLNPKLIDYDFGKCIKPEEIFLMITTFLLKEPEVIDTRTNDLKIEGHGFDTKKSFRNMKRN